MKVLVLGGTGFVGRNVIEALLDEGIETISATRAEGVDLRRTDAATACFATHQPEVIVNCAAHVGSLNYVTRQAAEVVADNLRMTLALYEAVVAACPEAVVINPIANCAYPATDTTLEEVRWWDGHLHRSVLSYGSTRRMLWAVAECFKMEHRVRSLNFLVPNMYGPHDSADPDKAHALNALIAKFVKAQCAGTDHVEVWGTGIAIREWLYAKDFARVVLSVIRDREIMGLDEPLNIGQNYGLSVRELVSLIAAATQFGGRITYNDLMPDGVPRKVMDDRRFRKIFPEFRFTSLDEGVAATVQHYRSALRP